MQIIIIDNFPIMTQIPNTVFRLKIASSTFEYVTIVIDEYYGHNQNSMGTNYRQGYY